MTPGSLQFDFVYGRACEFLLSLGISSLPVDPVKAIRKMHWGLVTYSELCLYLSCGAKVEDIAEACRSRDGFTVKSGGKYCIAYNDTVRVKSRVTFTLMHEAGHIVCGHFCGRVQSLSGSEYRALESEANCFASNVLAPAAVVTACGLRTPELIKAACGISFDAAKSRLNELARWRPRPVDMEIASAFDSFIRISRRRGPLRGSDIDFDEPGSRFSTLL